MGFMKSVGSWLGKNAGSLAGLGGGAFASSGNQGGMNTDSTWGQTGKTSQTYGGTETSRALEDPTGAAFRQSLIPQMTRMQAQAEQPVYGTAETAGYLNDLNDLTKDAMSNLRSNLAATGRLDSGGLGLGASDIEMGRLGEIAKFKSQIPLLNRQYQDQQRQANMQLAQGLAQTNKLGTTSTSSGTTMGTSEQGGTSQQRAVEQGAPWWKNLLGGAAGMFAKNAADSGQNPFASLFRNTISNTQIGKLPIRGSSPWLQPGAQWEDIIR